MTLDSAPFTLSQNWLFANTPKGSTGCAVIFSLIQTAIENGLNPYRYLTWLMKTAKDADLSHEDRNAHLPFGNCEIILTFHPFRQAILRFRSIRRKKENRMR